MFSTLPLHVSQFSLIGILHFSLSGYVEGMTLEKVMPSSAFRATHNVPYVSCGQRSLAHPQNVLDGNRSLLNERMLDSFRIAFNYFL